MSTFWIVGIVVNVGLTGLALWWVFRQMKPREPRGGEPAEPPVETAAGQTDSANTASGNRPER